MVLFPEPLAPFVIVRRSKPREATSRKTYHKCCYLASRNVEGEVLQNPQMRPCWIAETDPLDVNDARWICWCLADLGKGVYRGLPVDENKKLGGGAGSTAECHSMRGYRDYRRRGNDDRKENTFNSKVSTSTAIILQ